MTRIMLTLLLSRTRAICTFIMVLTSILIYAVAIIWRIAVAVVVIGLSIARPATLHSMCSALVRFELV